MRALPLLLLAGCAGPPAGTWTGQLSCGDEDSDGVIDILLELGRDDDTTFSGPGELTFSGTFELEGAWRDYREELSYDEAVLSLSSPSGAQQVALSGEAVACSTTVDGELVTTDCNDGDDLDFGLSWDGADAMTVDEGDCAGALARD